MSDRPQPPARPQEQRRERGTRQHQFRKFFIMSSLFFSALSRRLTVVAASAGRDLPLFIVGIQPCPMPDRNDARARHPRPALTSSPGPALLKPSCRTEILTIDIADHDTVGPEMLDALYARRTTVL